jgi:hypothetical protein
MFSHEKRKMCYLGYNFLFPRFPKSLGKSIHESLTKERLSEARNFLRQAQDDIAKQLNIFCDNSMLSTNTTGVSIMFNIGDDDKQDTHSDYSTEGNRIYIIALIFNASFHLPFLNL